MEPKRGLDSSSKKRNDGVVAKSVDIQPGGLNALPNRLAQITSNPYATGHGSAAVLANKDSSSAAAAATNSGVVTQRDGASVRQNAILESERSVGGENDYNTNANVAQKRYYGGSEASTADVAQILNGNQEETKMGSRNRNFDMAIRASSKKDVDDLVIPSSIGQASYNSNMLQKNADADNVEKGGVGPTGSYIPSSIAGTKPPR